VIQDRTDQHMRARRDLTKGGWLARLKHRSAAFVRPLKKGNSVTLVASARSWSDKRARGLGNPRTNQHIQDHKPRGSSPGCKP